MLKLIIFDFDGVIENNYELHFALSQKKITGITREEHRKLFEGNIFVEREKLKHRDTSFDLKKHFSDAKRTMVVNLKIKETLEMLSKNCTLGIVTSAREYGIQGYLEHNKMDTLFSFVYGFETGTLKTEKLKKVLQDFHVSTDECFFVTDTLGDILEANEVGIKTVAIDSGYHDRARLERGNPHKIISHLEELIPFVEKS